MSGRRFIRPGFTPVIRGGPSIGNKASQVLEEQSKQWDWRPTVNQGKPVYRQSSYDEFPSHAPARHAWAADSYVPEDGESMGAYQPEEEPIEQYQEEDPYDRAWLAGDGFPPRQHLPPGGHAVNFPPVAAVPPGLISISTLEENYRQIFQYPYFNYIQSQCYHDLINSNTNMVVSAPTGSGKTVLFELALVNFLKNEDVIGQRLKAVYIAPIKALVGERCRDWENKFQHLGIRVKELTGDTDDQDYMDMGDCHLVVTTPEKWDSMTRKWRDNKSLIQRVRLVMIDEVHLLNERRRGASLEAVICRMKTVQQTLSGEHGRPFNIRFVAVSATIPNIEDIAEWLCDSQGQKAKACKYGAIHRPVKLTKVVMGCKEKSSGFMFDNSLNYRLYDVIRQYSNEKPTLVFCATRKGTQTAAQELINQLGKFSSRVGLFDSPQTREMLMSGYTCNIAEKALKELMSQGVGYHHAGVSTEDRRLVEQAFIQGLLPVILATSTLAMGVNLPAHLVIVKSTQYYDSGEYLEYTPAQVLQMIGRAGRPQFDTEATAVIMTTTGMRAKYESLMEDSQMVESNLHEHLTEHLNAEIVLGTISDVPMALEWIKSTFLYIRVRRNPQFYQLPPKMSIAALEGRLMQEWCIKDLNSLSEYQMIKRNEETLDLISTDAGRMMARYYISFETMKLFNEIPEDAHVEKLLRILCRAKEYQSMRLRNTEKKAINAHNILGKGARYVINKGKIKTVDDKVCVLLQTALSGVTIADFSLNQDVSTIFRSASRIMCCMKEYLAMKYPHAFECYKNAVLLTKSVTRRLWMDSDQVVRQLDKIGPAISSAFVKRGITSFAALKQLNPRDIEKISNKNITFGNEVQETVSGFPDFQLTVEQVDEKKHRQGQVKITITLRNAEEVHRARLSRARMRNRAAHHVQLIVGDHANKRHLTKFFYRDFEDTDQWTTTLNLPLTCRQHQLHVHLINMEYVGLDVVTEFVCTTTATTVTDICAITPSDFVVPKPPKKQSAAKKGRKEEPNFDLVSDDDDDDAWLGGPTAGKSKKKPPQKTPARTPGGPKIPPGAGNGVKSGAVKKVPGEEQSRIKALPAPTIGHAKASVLDKSKTAVAAPNRSSISKQKTAAGTPTTRAGNIPSSAPTTKLSLETFRYVPPPPSPLSHHLRTKRENNESAQESDIQMNFGSVESGQTLKLGQNQPTTQPRRPSPYASVRPLPGVKQKAPVQSPLARTENMTRKPNLAKFAPTPRPIRPPLSENTNTYPYAHTHTAAGVASGSNAGGDMSSMPEISDSRGGFKRPYVGVEGDGTRVVRQKVKEEFDWGDSPDFDLGFGDEDAPMMDRPIEMPGHTSAPPPEQPVPSRRPTQKPRRQLYDDMMQDINLDIGYDSDPDMDLPSVNIKPSSQPPSSRVTPRTFTALYNSAPPSNVTPRAFSALSNNQYRFPPASVPAAQPAMPRLQPQAMPPPPTDFLAAADLFNCNWDDECGL